MNDAFRKNPRSRGGRVVVTPSVYKMMKDYGMQQEIIMAVALCDKHDFPEDPYGERDFRAFYVGEAKLYWKIDYYNADMTAGSEDPADPKQTTRVLTIMRAEEY